MALVLKDRVKETTTTAGNGVITLAGAALGYQSFAVIGNTNTTYYCISGQTTSEWEVGIGTYASSGTTLTRTTVLANSAGTQPTALVFSAGTKDVFVTYPSDKSVNQDAAGIVTLPSGSTLVAPVLDTPASGNFSTGTFTWPTFNQNTSGTAAGLSTTLALGSGGTGQTSAQLAMNALAGAVTNGYLLLGNGTNVVMAAPPTWNQSTTGAATGGASGAIAATTLSASSTVSGTGFSTYLASPPDIGLTAAAKASFTLGTITSQVLGFQSIATAAGTTTFTATSPTYTIFTGSAAQTLVLPDATTLTVGRRFMVDNDSTGAITVRNATPTTLWIVAAGCDLYITCSSVATAAGTWELDYAAAKAATGKALTISNTLTLTGTDASSVAFGTGGTVIYSGGALGTPSSGTLTNCTFPTLNQNTSGTAAGLSATLVIASGGTNSTATPTAGGAGDGTGTAHAYTAAGTAGQVLTSAGASAPTWSGINGGTF